jgi:hypothetical protein
VSGNLSIEQIEKTDQILESAMNKFVKSYGPYDRLEMFEIRRTAELAVEIALTPPDFKPAGEPDIYRDAWESLTDLVHGPNWIGQRVIDLAPTNPDLARRILALLSDEVSR